MKKTKCLPVQHMVNIPFFISTAGGAILSAVLIYSLRKANILHMMQDAMER